MFIITISRGSLSGAKSVSDALTEKLGVPVINREQVLEEADKYAIRETGFTDISFIDRAPNVWDRQYYRSKHYRLAFQVAMLELVMKGSCVYEGHLGNLLLTGIPFVLSTRIIQPEEKRIQHYIESNNVPYDYARNYIKLIDERRHHWSEFLYNVNIEDPYFYDLIINIDEITIDSVVEMLSLLVQRPEYNSNDDSMILLNNFYLMEKAKLYLFLAPVTRGIEVDVAADSAGKTLTIQGIHSVMDSDKSEMHIRSVLKKIEGIDKILFPNSGKNFYDK
ncbi:MAG: Response regulator receiver protein [Ignavibacteria bacterium]|nr:Response regulator receiver protein [Ignavibacteria bacterium]